MKASSIEVWLGSFPERTGVEYRADAEKHIRDEYSTLDWILFGMIERAGFTVDHLRRYGSCMASIIATKARDRNKGRFIEIREGNT
ncbi:MAG: hypothetical protein JXO72_02535 [Vicinamibacteria bacterium]|nr:hypothetical protein [Vicinamibacteria bacterium]